MSSNMATNPATIYFQVLREWAYPQVCNYQDKAAYTAAVREEAHRINVSGRHGRTPRQIENAVRNCADWTWKKFVEGEPSTVSVDRTLQMQLPREIDEQLQARAAAANIEVSELVSRWVLAELTVDVVSSDDLLALLAQRRQPA
ncbi:hypothetical protein [Nocardia jiangxiensis]|uniref:hypothetical protein n=1 Tax=Nocardia jiangxiensis TaxID=282685 RepID=UPI0002F9EC53|nr:hypothetical protein [Nocardia jiangxiensis]